jgi:hypothetical protein
VNKLAGLQIRCNLNIADRQNLVMSGLCLGLLSLAFLCRTSEASVQIAGFQLPALCAFKLITGFDCPGCGITRALSMAIHGHFYQSYMMHIWGIPLFFVLLFQVPYRIVLAIQPDKRLSPLLKPEQRKWLNGFIFGSLMLPWIAKTIAILFLLYL